MIAVLVVNWNDAPASARALDSARAASEVMPILVDNASDTDPTFEVRSGCPVARIERLPSNRGYAAACNHGVEVAIQAGASHILVMNNDAVLAPGALDALRAADTDLPGRVLAPVIVYGDDPGRVWSAGGYLEPPYLRNHHIGLGDRVEAHQTRRKVDWATGCALWFSVETWRRVGPMDEAFFLYLEDVDWCLTAARVGVETWVVPDAVVHHDVSRTTRALTDDTLRYYAYRNHFRLAFRHSRGLRRGVIGFELLSTLVKTAGRCLTSPSFRHDHWYHARTRAVRDFLLGRWGPEAPALSGAVA